MSFFQDLRLAVRTLRARPGLSLVIVVTLALGIGASTAMFSLVDAALLRPMPFAHPDRIAILWGSAGPDRVVRGASPTEVADWRASSRSFVDIAAYDQVPLNLRTTGEPEQVLVERVTSPYFALLGVRPARGRWFLAGEDTGADAHPVVVVSHEFWQRMGAPADVLGSTVTLDERPFTVVGVAPPGFRGLTFQAELWVPLSNISLDGPPNRLTERGNRWLPAVGLLRDGVTLAAAQQDMDRVAEGLRQQYPEYNDDRGVRLMSLEENALGSRADLFAALFGAVLLFLLITCANVASLQLVRASGRSREVAVRLALGARRAQVARQLLAEGLVLASLGGLAGVLVASWTVALLVPFAPPGLLPDHAAVAIDGRVLAFSAVITLLAGIGCGLAPAALSGWKDLSLALREGRSAAASGLARLRRPGLQQILVAGEVGLALMLLVGAGLMIRSLRERMAVEPGFSGAGVLVARVSLPRQRYEPADQHRFAERLAGRLAEHPLVASASVSSDLPLRGRTRAGLVVPNPGAEPVRAYRHSVTPGYFETLGITLRGRDFTPDDRAGSPEVAILTEATARRFWPGRDPIGMRFQRGSGAEVTVVGVVANSRFRDLTTEPSSLEPDIFYPFAQAPVAGLEIAVRFRTGVPLPVEEVRRLVAGIDPGLPLFAVAELTAGLDAQLASARFGSLVLGVFSCIALLLAAVGIYGVIAFVVGLARREIAIRMALGADPGRVLAVVVRNGMTLVVLGAAAGALGARAGASVLASQLYGVGVADPATFGIVTATLVAVALLASWLPARRAALVEPQAVLKEE